MIKQIKQLIKIKKEIEGKNSRNRRLITETIEFFKKECDRRKEKYESQGILHR